MPHPNGVLFYLSFSVSNQRETFASFRVFYGLFQAFAFGKRKQHLSGRLEKDKRRVQLAEVFFCVCFFSFLYVYFLVWKDMAIRRTGGMMLFSAVSIKT